MSELVRKNRLHILAIVGILGLLALVAHRWMSDTTGPRLVNAADAAATPSLRPVNKDLIRVLVANIRVPEPQDTGTKEWGQRREVLVKTLLKQEPDILGMQEVSPAQGAYLLKNLRGLELVPHGDDQTGTLAPLTDILGSMVQIYFRPDRWNLAHTASGMIRPEAPQTPITENTYYSLAVLEDKNKVLPALIVIDAHLRHGVPNAIACAQRLHVYIEKEMKARPGAQAIVLGDMNYDWTTPIYTGLRGEKSSTELFDTFDYSTKPAGMKWGTWHAFTGKPVANWPTDLIMLTGGLKAQGAAEIVRDNEGGVWPSDHFFVKAMVGVGGKVESRK